MLCLLILIFIITLTASEMELNGYQDDEQAKEQQSSQQIEEGRRQKRARVIQVLGLTFALCITVVLFSLPIVFHYVLEAQSSDTGTFITTNINPDSNTSNNTSSNSSCTTSTSWSVHSMSTASIDQCTQTGYHYQSDGVCIDHLRTWQQCTGEEEGDIHINGTIGTQEELDNEIGSLLQLLANYPECMEAAVPFMCRYYFPLKDCDNGLVYRASRDDCVSISTSVCAIPWQIASAVFPDRLPDCYTLSVADNNTQSSSKSSNDTASPFNVTCKEAFEVANNTCRPRCDRFDSHSSTATAVLLSSEMVAVSIGLFVCVLVIIFSAQNCKRTFTFPSVFLLFIIANYIVAAIIVIISAIDRNGLYCGSTDLIESLMSTTAFCSLSGAVFHYTLVGMTVWWFMHVTVFFYKVVFPFHARQLQNNTKKSRVVFVVAVVIGITAPLPAVIVTLTTEGYQLIRFPPSICSPGGDIFFYSVTIVIDVLLATGVCFLITIFWILHTNQQLIHSSTQVGASTRRLSTAEKKIMIVFIFFTIFGVYIMIQTGVTTAHAQELALGLTNYFLCEFPGNASRECDRNMFEKYSHPYLLAVTYVLLGFIPLTILNFVLNVRLTKGFVMKHLSVCRGKEVASISNNGTSTVSSGITSTATTSFNLPGKN